MDSGTFIGGQGIAIWGSVIKQACTGARYLDPFAPQCTEYLCHPHRNRAALRQSMTEHNIAAALCSAGGSDGELDVEQQIWGSLALALFVGD